MACEPCSMLTMGVEVLCGDPTLFALRAGEGLRAEVTRSVLALGDLAALVGVVPAERGTVTGGETSGGAEAVTGVTTLISLGCGRECGLLRSTTVADCTGRRSCLAFHGGRLTIEEAAGFLDTARMEGLLERL
jgi:hypothetical protein